METKREKKKERLAQSFDSKPVRDEKENLSCDEPRF